MLAEYPFDIKYIPTQSSEIAERYAYICRAPLLIEPLENFLNGIAKIPKFEAIGLQVVPPFYGKFGHLNLDVMIPYVSQTEHHYDFEQFEELQAFLDCRIQTELRHREIMLFSSASFIIKDINRAPKDCYRDVINSEEDSELRDVTTIKAEDGNLTTTLAIVNRKLIDTHIPLMRINARTQGLMRMYHPLTVEN